MDNSRYKLRAKQLKKHCNPALFKFESTADIKPLKGIIGQDRAYKSLSFGLDIKHEGYNIYLSGAFGTGKNTLARELLDKKAGRENVPSDWCYVHNFKNGDSPVALELSAGKGRSFKEDIRQNIDAILEEIAKALKSQDFESRKSEILNTFLEETNNMYLRLEDEARKQGFTISRTDNGVNSVPLKDGEVLNQEDFINMSDEKKAELMHRSAVVQEKINEAYRQYKELEIDIRGKVEELEKGIVAAVISPFFDKLSKKYSNLDDVLAYLQDMQHDMLNIGLYNEQEEANATLNLFRNMEKKSILRRYQVNLLVDNADLKHAPVVFESNPTFANLFGQIEYEVEFGVLATDFTRIKPGSVHKANGGYLVLNVNDIIKNFYVWDTLKRVIKNKEIVVENLSKTIGIASTETLQPQAIPVNFKVIIIGEPIYYYLLYTRDEEFQKLFKIRADFDTEMERSNRHVKEYARFIASVCEDEKLRHFTPAAVATVVDYSSRMTDDKKKLTTLFNKLEEIIYEADAWASYEKRELVSKEDVQRAISEKKYRSSMLNEKLHQYIKDKSLIINIFDHRVGEINGLAVYDMGDYSFGKPVRITAKTFMGENGLINIEREIHMSGSIHSKGVLTLGGYLGFQYAQDKALSLSASLTFEQSYGGIDGDSASSAELYALLSSLAEVPIMQGIAVSGSVNQNGEIQPVGGINQKIEGFFQVCKEKGFNGKQGVIIPIQNIDQLMLDDEIVEAVQKKEFNVWAIENIDQGLEILTGLSAGQKDEHNKFPEGSIHFMVDQKLKKWNNSKKSLRRSDSNEISTAVRVRRRRR